jgi:S-adenosylmethionine:tRNA ribosyltransferase-isomerase
MQADLLDYSLPERLIAQEPAARRDASRLLVVRRSDGSIAHHTFSDLPTLLAPSDLLVLNDTRVLPARLLGRRQRTGGKWEGLFLGVGKGGVWELLCQTRGRLQEGERVLIEPGSLQLQLLRQHDGHWFARPQEDGPALELLERHGHTPLPPYIRKGLASEDDRDRYQTIFARHAGAVAAPTAGLHFTSELFSRLDQRGINRAFLTLHVGLGTFQPIKEEDITRHKMHQEWGSLPATTVAAIQDCRASGGRVVSVGTTSVRLLESVAATGPLRQWSGDTDLFIYPPYSFRCTDVLLTNFHLPRSTLLLLVAAFAGEELTRAAYQVAVDREYRFFSYGDAMLIL